MNSVFDITRLGYFVRRQLYLNLSTLWIAVAAVAGTLLIISALFASFNPGDYEVLFGLRNLYLVVFFVGGFIFTSSVFHEMNSPQKSFTFLTLPVSTAERMLGAWFISSPVFILVYGIFMILLCFVSSLMGQQPEVFSSLFDRSVLTCVQVFLVTQTIFFVGACAFQGHNFLKTLLALFLIVIFVAGYSGGFGYLLFGGWHIGPQHIGEEGAFRQTVEFIFTRVIPFLFWFVLAPFLLVVSYYKLKERQV